MHGRAGEFGVGLGEIHGETLAAEPEGGAVGDAICELCEDEGGVVEGAAEEGDVFCGMGWLGRRHVQVRKWCLFGIHAVARANLRAASWGPRATTTTS
jgi:hypothetical protein